MSARPAELSDSEADRIALANVGSWNSLDDAPGELVEDPSTLQAGDMVVVRGHGKFRLAVVMRAGRKNATARFTTPGAVTEAEKGAAWRREAHARVDEISARYGEQAGKNWDFAANMTDPNYSFYTDGKLSFTPEMVAADVAEYKERLAKAGTREEAVARATQAERDQIESRYNDLEENGIIACTVTTNATVKPGKAKLVR